MMRSPLAFRCWPICAALLALPASGAPESLERCLAAFEGIRWRLPYRPYMHVYRCASPEASFNDSGAVAAESRRLELIGDTTLGPVRAGQRTDATFAQVEQAVFAHFDALLRRQGWQRLEVQEHEHESSGARYPARATYRRAEATLTWATAAANTWVIAMQHAGAPR